MDNNEKELKMIFDQEEQQEQSGEIEHYGTPRHSGRYPWGSGENPYHLARSVPGVHPPHGS